MIRLAGLIAYPATPSVIGSTIRGALDQLRSEQATAGLSTWEENDIAGRFLVGPVLSKIDEGNVLVADITHLNFNVVYEIGYAIGRRKRAVLIRNSAVVGSDALVREIGIFDTLGYDTYANSAELARILLGITDLSPLAVDTAVNRHAPVYLVVPRIKTDAEIRLIARIKKARLQFRTFDPEEHGRLPAGDAIDNVAQSLGVITLLLPGSRVDSVVHNFRAAFVAGLASALERAFLLLQDGDEPVPVDYRDLVRPFRFPQQIDEYVAEFSTEVTAHLQSVMAPVVPEPTTFLTQVNLGSSSAENELQDLGHYYLETDEFRRAFRGEVRIVTGRKGTGKTALFAQLRNRLREHKRRVVLDLKPEGFQLLKFKERVLDYLEEGTREHTITAFWEYLLLLETCNKILQKDEVVHMRDSRLYEPYRRLAGAYFADEYVSEGDFAERMLKLTQRIADDFDVAHADKSLRTRLTTGEITEILYKHDVAGLRQEVVDYLTSKEGLWILFDNLDKGWPAHGVTKEDVITLRCLIDAMGKIERQLAKENIECHAVIFIRNDVYELLVANTPDRGKVSQVTLDWTDPELLKELLRRRFVYSGVKGNPAFDDIWRQLCVSHIRGEETAQYMIERCLMRPRSLIDLVRFCRSHAVNLGHQNIDVEDIEHGGEAYSSDLLNNIAFEIRDVFPTGADALYEFIESPVELSRVQLRDALTRSVGGERWEELLELLLWYGFLGVVRDDEEVAYIYHVKYDIKRLKALVKKRGEDSVRFYINPAFWKALEVRY